MTKEERAKELAINCGATNDEYGHGYRKGLEDGYIIGANKQKAIDDAKYKKLRTLACDMYRKAQSLTTDASGLRKAMDAFHRFICFEESKMEE